MSHPSVPSRSDTSSSSVVGDPLFDPLFSGDSEGRRDRKADGGEPLIFLEMEEEPPGSSQGGAWPWDHIFRPNVRGRTEMACAEDINPEELGSSVSDTGPLDVERRSLGMGSQCNSNSSSTCNLGQPLDYAPLVDREEEEEACRDQFPLRQALSESNLLEFSTSENAAVAQQTGVGRRSPDPPQIGHRRRSGGIARQLQVPKSKILSDFDPLVSSDNHELANPMKSQSEGRRQRKHSPNAMRHTTGSPSSSRAKLVNRLQTKTGSKAKLNQAQAYPDRLTSGEATSTQLHMAQNNIISTELEQRKEEYCDRVPIRVFIGTWNVNGKSPDEPLTAYIGRASFQPGDDISEKNKHSKMPHLLALGFQELDLSPEALLNLGIKESQRETEWTDAVKRAVAGLGRYKLVQSVRLVGMMLLVLVQDSLLPHISEVDTDTIATGLLGVAGNKGGVAVRLKVHETSLCFVNCHLAAHMDEVEKRNSDYRQCLLRLAPGGKEISQHEDLQNGCRERHSTHDSPLNFELTLGTIRLAKSGFKVQSVVFWLGDLNYRITTSDTITSDMVKKLADNFQLPKLLKMDQLTQQQSQGKAFEDFTEGTINFKPTYKYDSGTSRWDTSDKNRPPAWCDRILHRGHHLKQLVYRSHHEMTLSDHKPVSSLFDVEVQVVDPVKKTQVLEDAFRIVDKQVNATLPQVTLDTQEVNFGDVMYGKTVVHRMCVTNMGAVPVQVIFQKKVPDDESCDICAPWLIVRPLKATISPQDYTYIHFIVQVNIKTAERVTKGLDRLEDILVLHLNNGKDYFITVTGNYLLSSFGASLTVLRYMANHGGIRGLPREEVAELYTKPDLVSSSSGAPLELWKLTDYLYTRLDTPGLFLTDGKESEIDQIRELLDCGAAGEDARTFGDEMVHSVAQAFLLFLESLAEPVIPTHLHVKCMEAHNSSILCRQVLHEMPEIHRNCFVYIIMFLKEVLKYSESNGSESRVLASIFANVLMQSREEEGKGKAKGKKSVASITKKKATFVYQFLIADSLL